MILSACAWVIVFMVKIPGGIFNLKRKFWVVRDARVRFFPDSSDEIPVTNENQVNYWDFAP